MLTIVTSAFFCGKPLPNTIDAHPNTPAHHRTAIHNIATAIDIITGFGLLFAGYYKGSINLSISGSMQLWPLCAFLTLVLFECQRGELGDTVIVTKKCPCCQGQSATPNT